jgi:DNA ligase-4
MSKWRNEVGNDFYPAMRLIIPDKDRDRPMYGLKEKAIGKLLVKVMKISPDSEDGSSLANWKRPSQGSVGQGAGNFALRCYEVLSKRAMRYNVGNMRIAEVNELLDKLAAAQGEAQQMPIFETFYERMNADELTWLIRIILRDMKLGASEKIILDVSIFPRNPAWELIALDLASRWRSSIQHLFQPPSSVLGFDRS